MCNPFSPPQRVRAQAPPQQHVPDREPAAEAEEDRIAGKRSLRRARRLHVDAEVGCVRVARIADDSQPFAPHRVAAPDLDAAAAEMTEEDDAQERQRGLDHGE